MFDANSYLATAVGSGLWPIMVLLSEVVQTLILADFCYYYVLSCAQGSRQLDYRQESFELTRFSR